MSQQVYDEKQYTKVGVGELICINNEDKNASSFLKAKGTQRYDFTYRLPTATNQHGFTHAVLQNYYLGENFYNIREGQNTFTLAFEEVVGSGVYADYTVTVPPGFYISYQYVSGYIKATLQAMLNVAHSHCILTFEEQKTSGIPNDRFQVKLTSNQNNANQNHKYYVKPSTSGPHIAKGVASDLENMLGMRDIHTFTPVVHQSDPAVAPYPDGFISSFAPTNTPIATVKVFSNLHKSKTNGLLHTIRIKYLGNLNTDTNTSMINPGLNMAGPVPLQLSSHHLSSVRMTLTCVNEIPLEGPGDFGCDVRFFQMIKREYFGKRTRIY